MQKKNLTGEILEKEMKFEVNYKGEEFNNYVNLTALNKRLIAVDKIIKTSLKGLIETKQIKNGKNAIADISIDIQRNSLDHTILVEFITGICADKLGNLIIDYLKYLGGELTTKLAPNILIYLNKNISTLNHFQSLIHIGNNTSIVNLNYKNNKLDIDNTLNVKIRQKINELKENIDIEEIEETLIGKILKLDIEKDKYLIKLDNGLTIPLEFADLVDFEDIRPVLKHKLVIESVSQYENGELKEIKVIEFRLARQPANLTNFTK